MKKTYDMALNPELYANEVAKKYGINLRGSGQEITIKFNPELNSAGLSRKESPTIIEIGSSVFFSEEELQSHLGVQEGQQLPYDILLVDTDNTAGFRNFGLEDARKELFCNSF